ncbi:hypothetical protein J6590_048548 [Homalodisca vitripennis]|nr:hypothetical protein J6590_048548 [Homalodisca vitripennis]
MIKHDEITTWTCNACGTLTSPTSSITQQNVSQPSCNKIVSQKVHTTPDLEETMLQAHDEIVTLKSYHFRSRLNNSLKELETSLSLAKPEAEDEKLAMAARIGLSLEEEDKFLQKENSKLMVNIVNLEAKIEEIQKEEETYLRRIESLLQKLEEREKQLGEGKATLPRNARHF